jgi:hypothetical protein
MSDLTRPTGESPDSLNRLLSFRDHGFGGAAGLLRERRTDGIPAIERAAASSPWAE